VNLKQHTKSVAGDLKQKKFCFDKIYKSLTTNIFALKEKPTYRVIYKFKNTK
jgi:hypothetical protein